MGFFLNALVIVQILENKNKCDNYDNAVQPTVRVSRDGAEAQYHAMNFILSIRV